MILVKELLNTLKKNKIFFYTGVPDSILKNLSNHFKKLNKSSHIIAANGGSAVSIGIDYYLSTKKFACVCLQNSGLVNSNLKHILLNNNFYESVGGQITNTKGINFKNLVKSIGYKNYFKIKKKLSMNSITKKFLNSKGPSLLEIFISPDTLSNLLRPDNLIKIKKKFIG